MQIGFIGLGNVGAKLAGSLLRNGASVTVRDLDDAAAVLTTCLPSPAISAAVMEGPEEPGYELTRRTTIQ